MVASLLLVGGGTAWFVDITDIAEVDPRVGLAVGLVVIGLALVLAAWRGRSRAALIPLGFVAVFVLVSGEVLDVPLDAGMGERTVTVDRRSDLDEPIELLAGELVVDLREVPLDAGRTTRVEIELGLGQLRVLVPSEADVDVDADVRVGDVDIAGADRAGADNAAGFLVDETYVLEGSGGTEPSEGRPRLELAVGVGVGEAEVTRG